MALDTTNALVSLAEAKTFLKITATSENSVIEDFINRASIWANDYTGRELLSRTASETFDGDGTDSVSLKNYPLVNIIDFRRTKEDLTSEVISTGYLVNNRFGIVKFIDGSVFIKGFNNYTITSESGYSFATLPESIKEAVLLYVGHAYRRQYADQKFGVQSETVGDRTTTYGSDDIIPKAKALLNPYRSERVLFSGF